MTRPQFDARDGNILSERRAARNAIFGPRLGDFVRMPDGSTRRFCHDWGDGIQITPAGKNGSFYLAPGGGVSYSGGLEPSIDKTTLSPASNTIDGAFWFFHHDHARAHNGSHFKIPCRVYQYRPAA